MQPGYSALGGIAARGEWKGRTGRRPILFK